MDFKSLACAANLDLLIWDLTGDNARERFKLQHKVPVRTAAFSPDGKKLATGADDKLVRVWDISGPVPSEPTVLEGHTEEIGWLGFTADGKTLFSFATGHNDLRAWDLTSPKPTWEKKPPGRWGAAAVSPRENLITLGYEDGVQVFDLTGKNPKPLDHISFHLPQATFSPDGRLLAIFTLPTGMIRLQEQWLTGKFRDPFVIPDQHIKPVTRLGFSADGKTLFSCTQVYDRNVRLWTLDRSFAKERTIIEAGATGLNQFNSAALAQDGKKLAVVGNGMRLLDLTEGEAAVWADLKSPGVEGVYRVEFSPDGRTLACFCQDDTLRFWDLTATETKEDQPRPKPRETAVLKGYRAPLLFSPDGKTLACGVDKDGEAIRLLDLTGKEPKPGHLLKRQDMRTNVLAFAPDGKSLACGGDEYINQVHLWDLSGEKPTRRLLEKGAPASGLRAFAFAPDGKKLAAAHASGDVVFWDPADTTRGPSPAGNCPGQSTAWPSLRMAATWPWETSTAPFTSCALIPEKGC